MERVGGEEEEEEEEENSIDVMMMWGMWKIWWSLVMAFRRESTDVILTSERSLFGLA